MGGVCTGAEDGREVGKRLGVKMVRSLGTLVSRGTACGDLNAQSLLTLFAARGDGGGLGVRFISLLYA